MTRRHRQYPIPAEFLTDLISLPVGSNVVNARWDAATDQLVFVVASPDFEPVATGAEAPIHALTIENDDPRRFMIRFPGVDDEPPVVMA